jgi:hypothetical protein
MINSHLCQGSERVKLLAQAIGGITNTNRNKVTGVRFQIIMEANMKFTAFWGIAPYSFIQVDQHFRST